MHGFMVAINWCMGWWLTACEILNIQNKDAALLHCIYAAANASPAAHRMSLMAVYSRPRLASNVMPSHLRGH